MTEGLSHMNSTTGRSLAWMACLWLAALSGCMPSRSAATRAMAKLRDGMQLAELEATMRAEGGTLERIEGLGEPATARYYRFGDELLRVDGSRAFHLEGGPEGGPVFIEWHVYDFYIYSPEAEERRFQEELERAERLKWMFYPTTQRADDPTTQPGR